MPQVGWQIVYRYQDAAPQQILDHQRSAAIRGMPKPDACLALQIFHRQVTHSADAGGTVTDLANSPLFAAIDEFLECAGGETRMHDDDVRHLGHEGYGREAPFAVIRDVLVKILVGYGGAQRAEEKGPPVRRSLGHNLRADIATYPLPIFDDKGRARRFGENLSHDPTEAIGSTARREGYDDAPGIWHWIAIPGPSEHRGSEEAAGNRCGYDGTTRHRLRHGVPPS